MEVTSSSHESHDDYQPMLDAVTQQFSGVTGPLFTTDADPEELWAAWLRHLPDEERQHHNCHCCRRFIERYAGLVTISADGETEPAFIGSAPGIYSDAFRTLYNRVAKARVNGVFLSSDGVWGEPSTPDKKRGKTWYHMHVRPGALRFRGTLLSASQKAAELKEDRGTLMRALAEYSTNTVRQALVIAESEALYRSEKVEGRLRWLMDLKTRTDNAPRVVKENIVWLAAATAPAGFCHVKSSVVGSLLEDLEAGKSFDAVKRAFNEKMHPLQYQRPQAPPSAGNIKQAEEIVAKLGVANSLRRRFARLEEVPASGLVWAPQVNLTEAPVGGVFGHLLNDRKTNPIITTGPNMTWEKFARTVLPTAEEISVLAPHRGNYTALVTAADPEAPPIIQWDRVEARNPVTWYLYSGGSSAYTWRVAAGEYIPVIGITRMPNEWQSGGDHHGRGVMLVMKGCRDTSSPTVCLFPEFLKSELHPIRSTIEAYSRSAKMEGAEDASACGLTIRAGQPGNIHVRVLSRGVLTQYNIDRWD